MERSKYRFGFGFANGLDSSERRAIKMFEEMARQGYLLEKRSPFAWKFALSEPYEYSFSTDYLGFVGTSDFEEYKAIFANAGWKYVCCYDGHYIFCAPKDTKPIYTDKDTLSAKFKRKFIANIILAICFSTAHIGIQVLLFDSLANLLTSWVFWLFYFPLGILPYLWCARSNISTTRRLKRE